MVRADYSKDGILLSGLTMHKRLLILGLMRNGPLSGYDVLRIVTAHGELYRDLRKANVYYLLERMAKEGLVTLRSEPGARGPRGERLLYSITAAGRSSFDQLLREVLRGYEPTHTGLEVAMVLADSLSATEATGLLTQRREAVRSYRAMVSDQLGEPEPGSAGDHLLSLVDTELAWVDRAIDRNHRRDEHSAGGSRISRGSG
jgi:DNA-binding PadR family transcriptional regulator